MFGLIATTTVLILLPDWYLFEPVSPRHFQFHCFVPVFRDSHFPTKPVQIPDSRILRRFTFPPAIPFSRLTFVSVRSGCFRSLLHCFSPFLHASHSRFPTRPSVSLRCSFSGHGGLDGRFALCPSTLLPEPLFHDEGFTTRLRALTRFWAVPTIFPVDRFSPFDPCPHAELLPYMNSSR